MDKENITQQEAEALLKISELKAKWIKDANRIHTKNLFGLWLLIVVVLGGYFCLPPFNLFRQNLSIDSILISGLNVVFILFILTGAYIYQEVSRLHKRIDAIMKLLDDKKDK